MLITLLPGPAPLHCPSIAVWPLRQGNSEKLLKTNLSDLMNTKQTEVGMGPLSRNQGEEAIVLF